MDKWLYGSLKMVQGNPIVYDDDRAAADGAPKLMLWTKGKIRLVNYAFKLVEYKELISVSTILLRWGRKNQNKDERLRSGRRSTNVDAGG